MVKVVVGMMGSSVSGGAASLSTPSGITSFLSIVKAHNITELDTARVYASGQSETMLGSAAASHTFSISTKAPAFAPNSLAYDKIISNCNASLAALKIDKVDIYYLHGPDRATPLTEQCRAIGKLYDEGKFSRFGVSNISDAEVQQIHDICAKEGYVLPSVYQGGYNPIGRGAEATLFPLLRKLGMSFYAFSPLAGGLLAKPLQEVVRPKEGTRFEAMKVFGDIYLTEEIKGALERVQRVCDEMGVGLMEATLRWFMHHAGLRDGDAVILGASTEKQIEGSLKATEGGKLTEELVQAWRELGESLKGKLPGYHS